MAIGVVCILADGTNFKGLYYSTMKMKMTRKSEWYRRQLVVVVVACCIGVGWDTLSSSAAALANNDDSSSTLSTSPPPPLLQCDLYMAESTIPHAGLGIFTGVDRKEGDTVGNGDLCLPLIDIEVRLVSFHALFPMIFILLICAGHDTIVLTTFTRIWCTY